MKVTKKENIRVVAYVSTGYLNRDEEWIMMDAEEAELQIKRHVDNVASTEIKWDSVHTCSFCGHGWDVSQDDDDPDCPKGMPLCCEYAQREFMAGKEG